MPCSCKSSVSTLISTTKPMNVFYIWYAELCRRSNTSPLGVIKPPKPKNDTVLDFTADRIKAEEWTPILTALRLDTSLHVITIRSRVVGCKFLYEVNTEDRVRRMKRKYASLWTDYILRSLMRSLSNCIKNSQVLSSLELDGLPLSMEYLEMLFQTLRNNRTIKMLSFKHSPINDGGCQQLCLHLRFMPNVEVLNLSSCNLSSISGQHIARVIKHQQINRYCESWHKSLRYADPTNEIMAGLKRVTLNNNPGIGDEGLSYILNELDDDLWIKAIDMQKCNITESLSRRIIDVVQYSRALEVADFRDNEHLSFATIEKILDILEKKQQFGLDPEYQWCATSTTLYDFTTCRSSCSTISGLSTVQKSKSAPIRQLDSARNSSRPSLRRIRTLTMIDRKPRYIANLAQPRNTQLDDAKKRLSELNTQLQQEKSKREETEKVNSELHQKLEQMKKLGAVQMVEQQKLSKVIRIIEDLGLKDDEEAFPAIKTALSKRDIKLKTSKSKTATKGLKTAKKRPKTPKKPTNEGTHTRPKTPKKTINEDIHTRPKTPKKITNEETHTRPKTPKNEEPYVRPKTPKKSVKEEGNTRPKTPKKVTKENTKFRNAFSPERTLNEPKALAQNIFEKFLFKDGTNNECVDDDDIQVDNVLNYYYDIDSEDEDSRKFHKVQLMNAFDSDSSLTRSNASLERFLQEINVVEEDLQFETNPGSGETTSRMFARDSSQDPEKNHFRKFMVQVS